MLTVTRETSDLLNHNERDALLLKFNSCEMCKGLPPPCGPSLISECQCWILRLLESCSHAHWCILLPTTRRRCSLSRVATSLETLKIDSKWSWVFETLTWLMSNLWWTTVTDSKVFVYNYYFYTDAALQFLYKLLAFFSWKAVCFASIETKDAFSSFVVFNDFGSETTKTQKPWVKHKPLKISTADWKTMWKPSNSLISRWDANGAWQGAELSAGLCILHGHRQ